MQTIKLQQRSCSSLSRANGQTLRARPFTSARTSRGTVQVFAKKGKSRGLTPRMAPGMAAQQMGEPPVPEVDPENAEFVVFVRAKNYSEGKITIAEGPWLPLSVFRGSQPLNFLVRYLETEWGRKLYSNLLISQIATGLYKDRENIERKLRQNVPQFVNVPSKSFEYAFKLRDKSNPKAWRDAVGITPIPAEKDIVTGIDNIKNFFSAENFGKIFQSS
eukprot:CAMPEP_0202866144 /NCGR_PEP_ID=MMETSP1391-20130828/7225_1 /ASSEMBLY_ACC=CAM_ASM_000867 /TAXON_ID=1034604 /ORGANISM="Chlamydomonas leiostraca, Strain SAG 11-49" /LENGTH=217 /DNA_ID=CAMNT_0049546067 /DNA_START=13 /DNA_END=666 /DNA_ORIENTATION=-